QEHQVYSAIARKIEELIVSLNETGQDDKHRQELCRNINMFLVRLERSVNVEWKSAGRTLKDNSKTKFLTSIRRELDEIKQLEAYVTLASRKPKPDIIRKIHALYQQVDEEISEQEALTA
ncbi:MAG: hypothetical protein Q7K45_03575, partial [Nanoarchaeota archaeon]|nr:hypothetical protein [Nanoarchaeota archaeon]